MGARINTVPAVAARPMLPLRRATHFLRMAMCPMRPGAESMRDLAEDGAHSEDDEGVSDEQMRVAQS